MTLPEKQAQVLSPAPVVPLSDVTAVILMIERAAKDPNVDIDKMERLLKVRDQIRAEQKEEAFNDAMAKAQAEMRPVAADLDNPQTRSRYASAVALDRALRPIYTSHGFALSFNTEDGGPEGCIRLACYVTNSGHTRVYRADMPSDGKGAKGGDVMTKTHAVGSAMTYGQRYLLKLIFNIAVGPDDDGNRAGGRLARPMTTLPKKDARSLYSDLQTELNERDSCDDLEAWGKANGERIKILPDDWQDILRLKYQERKLKLRAEEAGTTADITDRVVWDDDGERPATEDDGIPPFLDRRPKKANGHPAIATADDEGW